MKEKGNGTKMKNSQVNALAQYFSVALSERVPGAESVFSLILDKVREIGLVQEFEIAVFEALKFGRSEEH